MNIQLRATHAGRAGRRYACFLLFFITLLMSLKCTAALLVTPSRVVFEDRTRTAQVTLVNKGTETATYRISFIRQNMTEDGKFVPAGEDESGLYSDTMVRYSPRQITLSPGQSQIVRLMLRKPKNLPDGEYRSHMLLQALPETSKSDISKAVAEDSDEISVEITTIIGVSIPVIVRNGKLDTELSLSNASYVKSTNPETKSHIALDMNRTGSESTYGDFRVTYIDGKGQAVVVGNVKGVAVYTPNQLRKFKIPLNAPAGVVFDKGHFHITYTESGKDEKNGLIASVDVQL
jgi:P pilus assembly chaperone PapD